MHFKYRSYTDSLLSIPDAKSQLAVDLKIGAAHTLFSLSNNSTRPGEYSAPTVGQQMSLLFDLIQRSIQDARSESRIFKNSTVLLEGDRVPLSRLMDDMKDVQQMTVKSRISESLQRHPHSGTTLNAAVGAVSKTWLSVLKHTGSLESIYLQMDNPHYLKLLGDYVNDTSKNAYYFSKSLPTVAGSLGRGVQQIVFGHECASPQGMMQVGFMLAKRYMEHIQIVSQEKGSAEASLAVAQMNEGRALFEAMPSLTLLVEQVRDRNWETSLLSAQDIQTLESVKERMSEIAGDEVAYLEIVMEAMRTLGERHIQADAVKTSEAESVQDVNFHYDDNARSNESRQDYSGPSMDM